MMSKNHGVYTGGLNCVRFVVLVCTCIMGRCVWREEKVKKKKTKKKKKKKKKNLCTIRLNV